MTIKELIELLSAYDSNLTIGIDYDTASTVTASPNVTGVYLDNSHDTPFVMIQGDLT